MHRWYVRMLIDSKLNKFLRLVRDIVLLQRLVHVQGSSQSFPSVAGSVLIQVGVTVENFIKCLLACHLYYVVILCLLVYYAK